MTKVIRHKLKMPNGMIEEFCSCPVCNGNAGWWYCRRCGFCGWASGCNRIPFIKGFVKWCDYLVKK